MSDIGKPCYNHDDDKPCYKHGGSLPVYKVSAGDITEISFAWGSDGSDLDIWAYWEGAPNMCAGYRKPEEPQSIPSETWAQGDSYGANKAYRLWWSGDDTTVGGTEIVRVIMRPWSIAGSRTLRIKLNFYGYDSERHPGSTCTVIASQLGGGTMIKRNVSCGTSRGSSAVNSSSSVAITFDSTGKLIGIN